MGIGVCFLSLLKEYDKNTSWTGLHVNREIDSIRLEFHSLLNDEQLVDINKKINKMSLVSKDYDISFVLKVNMLYVNETLIVKLYKNDK